MSGWNRRNAALPRIKVCGKTGTAQVLASAGAEGAKLKSDLANNAWFVAFAPMEAPEIAVVALLREREKRAQRSRALFGTF